MQTQTRQKTIGLRNVVTTRERWAYLFFYDLDYEEIPQTFCDFAFREVGANTAYLMYRTKHGAHLVGLTPLEPMVWGYLMQACKTQFPNYYSGQTIRVSRKKDEIQEFMEILTTEPVIPRLYEMYRKRFTAMPSIDLCQQTPEDWHCVFEKYWTGKL